MTPDIAAIEARLAERQHLHRIYQTDPQYDRDLRTVLDALAKARAEAERLRGVA